jgi:hypothetical protein
MAETGRVSGCLCQAPSEIHRRLAQAPLTNFRIRDLSICPRETRCESFAPRYKRSPTIEASFYRRVSFARQALHQRRTLNANAGAVPPLETASSGKIVQDGPSVGVFENEAILPADHSIVCTWGRGLLGSCLAYGGGGNSRRGEAWRRHRRRTEGWWWNWTGETRRWSGRNSDGLRR